MATKQAVSKTQAVREYLKAHPAATNRDIVAALDKQGIKITLNHVATIQMVDEAKKAAVVEKPAETLTLDQIKKVAEAIDRIRPRKAAAKTAVPPAVEKPANALRIIAQAIRRIRSRSH